ncbi:MAG: hypothetical protein RL026_1689 [Pseudomonadota bacterium]|jgi:NADPH2:quinone reductase
MPTFRALRLHELPGNPAPTMDARLCDLALDDLTPGGVVVRVAWSGINYKDALAVTGAGRILRRSPLVGGVDLAGTVLSSDVPTVAPGDRVLVTGCGLSETRDGGYAAVARVPADAVIPLPPGFDLRQAMILGTAGFTAGLALHRMEHNGQSPAMGPVVVSGATGGVGSIAVDLLAGRGYEVWALTRKADAASYLTALGATRVLAPAELGVGDKPLESVRWGGAIDNVGGSLLSGLLRGCAPWGNVASIGLAAGPELHTSVMPFILRGVNLLGINSSATLRGPRLAVWQRLATDLRPRHLDAMVAGEVSLDDIPSTSRRVLAGTHRGRFLVRIGGDT